MEKEMREYLDKNFAKLATKEELNLLSSEVKATKEEVGVLGGEVKAAGEGLNILRSEVRAEGNNLRAEMKGLEERVFHQFHITAEGLRYEIKLVAEGVINLNEKFDREISSFRREVAYSHEELKAMIKFSYSELDRRLTSVESELDNLKHRVEKIERGFSHP